MKQRIRLTESDLHRMIKESVQEVLRESIHKEEVFTISAYDIVDDTEINDFSYDHDFYNEEEAIESAIEYAQSLVDEENVIIITVFGGEFCDENGNVTGEPFEIFTVSNKDKQTTAIARKRCGYTNLEVDYYVI